MIANYFTEQIFFSTVRIELPDHQPMGTGFICEAPAKNGNNYHYRPTTWENSYIFVICQAHFILIFKNCKSANFYYIFFFEFILSHIFSIVPLEARLDPELLAFEVSQMLSHSFL